VVIDEERVFALDKDEQGYWIGSFPDVQAGDRYMFRLNGELDRPDPASRSQPDGVHGSSEIVDHSAFQWSDQGWKGMAMRDMIIYELHVGTYSPEGTFQAVIGRLPELLDLGITAIELMPVAQFPGDRNWGYDGVYPFAPQISYGGVEGLKKLVDACHRNSIAVVLDVVYNHFGPEGNYTNDFAPYFTEKYMTPWGAALNFDDAHSDHVRNFFIQNAMMWLRDYHIDALRLDAVHAILDTSAKHFLQELHENKEALQQETGRQYTLIAESDLSDRRLIDPVEKGGYGLEGQWMDDLHHAIHTLLTGESDGYYHDFGKPGHLIKALKHSFVFNGTYSEYRQRTVGSDATDCPASQFVVCIQNHDQVGNRMLGERLSQLIPWDMLKVAAGLYILSPYVPLLFMGEEYGETNPFLYFVSHGDKELMEAVRKGRREEFKSFAWKGEAPDPRSEETFLRSKLQRGYLDKPKKNGLREFYKRLIALKKTAPALVAGDKEHLAAFFVNSDKVLHMIHTASRPHLYALFNISDEQQELMLDKKHSGSWELVLDSSDPHWNGSDAAHVHTTIGSNEKIILAAASMIVLERKDDE
jgi:maltooligosyltrehalose trehalohydrolase